MVGSAIADDDVVIEVKYIMTKVPRAGEAVPEFIFLPPAPASKGWDFNAGQCQPRVRYHIKIKRIKNNQEINGCLFPIKKARGVYYLDIITLELYSGGLQKTEYIPRFQDRYGNRWLVQLPVRLIFTDIDLTQPSLQVISLEKSIGIIAAPAKNSKQASTWASLKNKK